MNPWRFIQHQQQTYPDSLAEQENVVADILAGKQGNTIIFTGHPPIYTLGTSAREEDILNRNVDGELISVFASGRGGEITYHGPGQLICYVLRDLREHQDLHRHVQQLEELIIRTLAHFSITASRNPRGIGVWAGDEKIAAVGVRCRKWVTFHGIALNIHPNLKHFSGIVPCGMRDAPVTSMHELGVKASREEVESFVRRIAAAIFS
ncbi:MAG: lipoyl(octanoyl) transferase [Zetaproteobacteria bacterium CG_4_9_14_3_um_filter_49_83]|nr:MAG: lipoyl(octanoyl) transferase [Zetaproteobacteria bacterium CG1_02_49_23]PIQ30089.1 MAG: lipoyl(octanoyl) transferase [Zetaproteobacteria bacterium CG17_big_fil_post_rev_8_21_14_2_50_50_13]PIV31541.1 MAG: lipoyl(octanoyl) transferase [Zetaproteobacteria bacterium CG02_land_8_20_14_3_00_50_9]PIY55963.1 MAG: lipoyl(octanoyl) transferase [Zetaproteobacteria bacterium CG_4_10_14_0_8_um_filter_49_80]PJA36361.1 MAG: lipoyl(octanoyl) transferase [Zetaproteobacteria bacterium CG_4_9_14_3_um_filt